MELKLFPTSLHSRMGVFCITYADVLISEYNTADDLLLVRSFCRIRIWGNRVCIYSDVIKNDVRPCSRDKLI